ncbi:MAG: Smr/MutS family protein [Saprospiraceae bacterium]|jgi:dsDNA-specific endonuclease/ATPase MutS2|nr:Smr/MutS family protein [Saprospiraceae bacterium]
MIPLKDLWIGESVLIRSSGKTGRFEGINKEGKARIRVENKILLVTSENLDIVPEKEHFPDIHDYLNEEKNVDKKITPLKITFDHTLDLHIDKLAPHMENELPARIMEFQLRKSDTFIRDAIDKKYPHITIIHGKGQGVLKEAIEHQLQQFHQIRFTFSKNGGGAVEVWL